MAQRRSCFIHRLCQHLRPVSTYARTEADSPLPTPFETFRRRRQYGGPPGLAGISDAALIILATPGATIPSHIQVSQRRSPASPCRISFIHAHVSEC